MSSNTLNQPGYGAETQELDLVRLLGELIAHRLCISVITLLCATCGLLYALFATPVYVADAMVQIEQQQQNNLLKSLNALTPDFSPDSTAEIQLLKSRMILGKTVDDLRLRDDVTQARLPFIGKGLARLTGQPQSVLTFDWLALPSTQPVLTLTVEKNGRFLVTGEGFSVTGEPGKLVQKSGVSLRVRELQAPEGTTFKVRQRTRLQAINSIAQRLTVTEKGKESGMLELSLTGTDRAQIAATLNHIAAIYLQQNIARQAAQDSQSLEFLQQQLPKVRSELDEAEGRLNNYRKKRDSVDLTLEAKSVLEQIVNVDNQLNELTFREAEISQLYKKEHPTYRALQDKRHTLEKERERLNRRVGTMPSTQQEILRLSRDVDTGRAVYLQLLTRQQELNISRSSTIGNVRIIDPAVAQPDPVKPRKGLVVILATLMGFMLSSGLVLAKSAIRQGIDSPEQLESQGINVYATLPRSEWLSAKTRAGGINFWRNYNRHKTEDVPYLPFDRPMDIFVEAIRGLRTSLHFAMMDADNNILMFSGPAQNCGKTLVSTTLAALVAQVENRVLLIDADMRKGYVHNIFGLENDRGLSNLLSGQIAFHEAVQSYRNGNFDVVTCGQYPPNPSELLMHARFKEFMNWASENYDMVIIDTPPILAVTDAALVGCVAGSTLLVARHNVTSVKEVMLSARRLQQMGASIKGAIINDVVKSMVNNYKTGYGGYAYAASQSQKSRSSRT